MSNSPSTVKPWNGTSYHLLYFQRLTMFSASYQGHINFLPKIVVDSTRGTNVAQKMYKKSCGMDTQRNNWKIKHSWNDIKNHARVNRPTVTTDRQRWSQMRKAYVQLWTNIMFIVIVIVSVDYLLYNFSCT